MRPGIDLLLFLLAASLTTLVACGPPSPDAVILHDVQTGGVKSSADPHTRMNEGDLFIVDADPVDGDDKSMDLCVDSSVQSESNAVRVSRVRGSCRRFVVVAQSPGSARIRFEVRGTASELVLNVFSPE